MSVFLLSVFFLVLLGYTYVGAEHDGRLLGGRKSHHLDVPGVGSHRVGDVAHDLSREALLAIRVHNGECDGVGRMRDNGEVALPWY